MVTSENSCRQRYYKASGVGGLKVAHKLGKWKVPLTNLALGLIIQRVMEVKLQFEFISFSHVYREFNTKADSLSKEALSLPEDSLLTQEFRGADLLSENMISVF